MNPSSPEQLTILTNGSLNNSQKIEKLLDVSEGDYQGNRSQRLMALIDRVKVSAVPEAHEYADPEKAEVWHNKKSSSDFIVPRLPITEVPEGELALGFFIFTPSDNHYSPSINAQWFLTDSSGETRLLQEYASSRAYSNQLATLGLIEQSVELYEEARQRLTQSEDAER